MSRLNSKYHGLSIRRQADSPLQITSNHAWKASTFNSAPVLRDDSHKMEKKSLSLEHVVRKDLLNIFAHLV